MVAIRFQFSGMSIPPPPVEKREKFLPSTAGISALFHKFLYSSSQDIPFINHFHFFPIPPTGNTTKTNIGTRMKYMMIIAATLLLAGVSQAQEWAVSKKYQNTKVTGTYQGTLQWKATAHPGRTIVVKRYNGRHYANSPAVIPSLASPWVVSRTPKPNGLWEMKCKIQNPGWRLHGGKVKVKSSLNGPSVVLDEDPIELK